MSAVESQNIGLNDLRVKSTCIDPSADEHIETDVFGNIYRWEVAPGQENLDPEETQEIIITRLNPYE